MRILLFSRHHEPDLLKATTMKTVIVPTYVRKDGTVVPSHAKLVHYDPDKGAHQIVSGNGSHSQKLAHKKLHASVPGFAGLPDEEQAIHIMSSATNSQKKASLSGMLSKWKASLLAGKKPSESEAKAFAELQNKDPSAAYKKQKEVTDVIGIEAFAALGSTFISANKTPDQESAASLIDERWETLSAVPKEAVPGVLQGLADALGYDVSDMKAAFDAKKAAKPSAVRVTDVATDSALDRMKIPPAMQGALLKPSVTIKTKNADGVHPTISWKEYVDSYVDAGATITEWFAKPKGAHVGYLLDKDGKKVTLPDAALWYAEAAIAFKKKHAAQPTAALPLSEKPAYDYLANISKKSGGNMNTVMGEAENWLDANPGKEDELSSSLVDLGYLLVAKQMGIYKPPMLHSAFTGGAYKFISDHLDDPAVMGYRSPKEAARAWLAHNNGKDAEANQALIDHGYSSSATLGNGETTGLNAKTNAEAAVATAKLQEIASGQGGHYPHKAYKKLEHDSDWIKLGPVARLEVVLALAKQMQQTANASSAVTGWKKVALAGSNPAPAQWTAFLALDADKKSKLLDEVKAKHGNWHHLVHPAAAKAPEKPEPKIILPTGPKDGDTKAGADGTLVFKDGRWHKQSGSSAYAVTSMAQSLNNEGPIHDVSAHAVAVEKKLNLKPGSLADAQGYSPTYTVQSADGKMFSVYAHSGVVRVRTSGNNTDQESAKALVAFLDGVQKKPKLTPKEYGAAAFAAGKPHAPLADNDFWSAHSEGSLSPSFKAMEEWSKGWDDANLNAGAQKQSTAQAAAPIQAAVPPSAASVDQGTNTDFVTYHNTTDGHSKFWSVCVQGDSLITKYGKIGAKGTATVKELGSNAAAHAQMAKLIKQKSAGGYVLHSDAAPAPYKTPAPDGGLVLSPEKPTGVGFEQALDNIQKFIGDGNTSGIQQELLLLHGLTSPGAKAAKKYAQDGIDYLNSIGGEGPKEGDTKPIKPTGIGYPSTLTNIEDWINDGNVGQLKITLDALNGISSLSAKAAAKYAQDGLDYLSGAAGPKEGDTKQGADGMLVFKGGRWHKVFTGKKLTDAEIAKVASWPNNGPAKEAKTAAKAGDGAKLNDIYWSAKEGSFPKTAAKIAKLATLMGVPLVKPAGSKAAPEPSAAPSSTPPGPKVIFSNATKDKNGGPSVTSMAGWVKTGDQKGSNPGGTFKDKNGQSWYVKFPATEDHCKNELLASKLYKAAGVDVPNLRLVSKDGKVGIASKIVDGVSKVGAGIKSAPGALEGFAVDAWPARWSAGKGLPSPTRSSAVYLAP
jgi:predicted DNA-binding WGR domain protein